MLTSLIQTDLNNPLVSRRDRTRHIVIISGQMQLAEALQFELIQADYRVSVIYDGLRGMLAVQRSMPDLVIADWSSPRRTGVEICERLRASWNSVPIILLTQGHEVQPRVAGLRAGANDCLSWPLDTEELIARVQANLPQPVRKKKTSLLRCADLTLNHQTREVFRSLDSTTNDQTEYQVRWIDLTAKEFDFLAYMMTHYYQVLTRAQILENVWGYNFLGSSNIIEVYVRYLRKKLEARQEDRLIHTVRGVGYILREPGDRQKVWKNQKTR